MEQAKEETRKLKELRGRIEHWRSTRKGQGPMPEALWVAATAAAKRFGVTRVAKELTVGHAGLRRRLDGARGRQARRPRAASGFLQVTGAQLLTAQPAAPTLVEFAARDGSRLTVTVPGGSGVDVPALVSALRGP
jgi:hypothetical protein